MSNIKDIIRELVRDEDLAIHSKVATVKAVREQERTVDLEPIDGSADILGARLSPTIDNTMGVVVFPKIESRVVVSFFSPSRAWVSLVDDPEKTLIDTPELTINGGGKGGLIEIEKLKAEIEKLNSNFNTLKSAVKSAAIVPADGGASFKAALAASLVFSEADLSNITNEKVTHG